MSKIIELKIKELIVAYKRTYLEFQQLLIDKKLTEESKKLSEIYAKTKESFSKTAL